MALSTELFTGYTRQLLQPATQDLVHVPQPQDTYSMTVS